MVDPSEDTQLAGLSDDTQEQMEANYDDTFNRRGWSNSEDLLGKAVTVPLTISKDTQELNKVKHDPTLKGWRNSGDLPGQPFLSSPVAS